jgi:hypothetical protein
MTGAEKLEILPKPETKHELGGDGVGWGVASSKAETLLVATALYRTQ